jgi:hypothetical protein
MEKLAEMVWWLQVERITTKKTNKHLLYFEANFKRHTFEIAIRKNPIRPFKS